ncbi:hypothetical protein J7426_14365 [Tropicibacter sp. R16_0]|uniref:gpW family head-tail joining protein n=1 Tax=Tropicibacter sp. R16_0 TaxID=2821102 RepID=UPI001ADABAE6|nr:gpW family head-tail joining protein [Tropicibacter sp. R16_0]MBO9451454.1 hypothetical protein [Tropicibacter sp. R16_0]
MTDTAVLEQRLTSAEEALHKLMTGTQVVSVDYDGAATTFSKASEVQLRRYIRELQRKLGKPSSGRSSRRVAF